MLEKGAVEDREYRIISADGEIRWLSDKCFISRQAEPDQRVIVVGIAEDITEKKLLEDELQRLATTDVLTGSSNRRHFFECAHREFEQARLQGSPLAFLLLDIDDFKQINDTYGHPAGDQVLQRIAETGRSALRSGDLFGRIGGEEFAARRPAARLCPGHGADDRRAPAAGNSAPGVQPGRGKLRHHRQPGPDQPDSRG